jgi:hypothetical protein
MSASRDCAWLCAMVRLGLAPRWNHSPRPVAPYPRSDIYNWFTDCFDTADLKDAKKLLDELNA